MSRNLWKLFRGRKARRLTCGARKHLRLEPLEERNLLALAVTGTTMDGNLLRDEILGVGVTPIGNATFIGSAVSAGFFTGGATSIGINSGIVLTTGDAGIASGPNLLDFDSGFASVMGDPDLDAHFGFPGPLALTTTDSTVLQFDFQLAAAGDLLFNFVFASEEYNEFANTAFNDVFAFFVDGVNVGLVPGTMTPVSINSVNGGNPVGTMPHNPQFYRNNDLDDMGQFLSEIGYDGFTEVFTATRPGLSAGIHTITLAISDVSPLAIGDQLLDSAVFIEAGSFTTAYVGETRVEQDAMNNLVITDIAAGGKSNNLTLRLDSLTNEIVITEPPNQLINTVGGVTTGRLINPHQVRVPFAPSSTIIVNSLNGNDVLTIDFSGGNPIPGGGIQFNGGAPATSPGDALKLVGGNFGTVVHTMTGPGSGHLDLDNNGTPDITYTGLEPVDMTGSTAMHLVFNLPSNVTDASLEDFGVANDGLSQIRSFSMAFENTPFANPLGSLTINAVGGSIVALHTMDMNFNPGAITFNGLATDTFRLIDVGAIPNATAVTVDANGADGSATLDLNNLDETIGSLAGQGNVTLGAGRLTTGGNNANTTFSGTIGGSGGLTKQGNATFTLSGSNTYTGTTFVSSGTLSITGSTTTDVTVAISATLTGTGSTGGTVHVNDGGRLAPGVTIGILNSGGITFDSGGLFDVQIAGPTPGNTAANHDQLNVAGAVILNAATLVLSGAYTPLPGDAFVIINNDGTDPVSGSFDNLPEGSQILLNGVSLSITYTGGDGNDVVLVPTTLVVTTSGGALSYFENDPATAIDAGLTVTDAGSSNLTGATVAITTGFAGAQDVLAFINQLGITGSYNAMTGVLTLGGTTSVANYQTALRTVTYVNTSEVPSTAPRTITFTATDGTFSGSAARTINVFAVNDAPQTANDDYVTNTDQPLTVDVSNGVLINDTDLDFTPPGNFVRGVDVAVRQTGANIGQTQQGGALTLNADGSFLYTPPLNFSGQDTFTYVANDGFADSNEATATIQVGVTSWRISGFVYFDANKNGLREAGERGIAGVDILLSGVDFLGNAVNETVQTRVDGSYQFDMAKDPANPANMIPLRPGTYEVTETQPPFVLDGLESRSGTVVPNSNVPGQPSNDRFANVDLLVSALVTGLNFGERGVLEFTGTLAGDDYVLQPNGTNTEVLLNNVIILTLPSSIIESITINGLDGDDTLLIRETANGLPVVAGSSPVGKDNPNILNAPSILFNGGLGKDAIRYEFVSSGVNQTYAIGDGLGGGSGLDSSEGEILTVSGSMMNHIYFTGLEPISVIRVPPGIPVGLPSGTLTILGDVDANDFVIEANGNNTRVRASTGNNAFESFEFPAGTFANVVINGLGGNDTFDVTGLGPGFAANLEIDGGDGVDSAQISGSANLDPGNAMVRAENIQVSGAVIATTGNVRLEAGIDANISGAVNSGGGSLVVTAGRHLVVEPTGRIVVQSGMGSVMLDGGLAISMRDGSSVHAAGGNITLLAQWGILISRLVTSGSVSVTSPGGGIADAGDLDGADIEAASAVLRAATSIGARIATGAEPLLDVLETRMGRLDAAAGGLGIFLVNSGMLIVDRAEAVNGTVDITTMSPLVVTGTVRGKAVNLTALPSASASGPPDDLTIGASATVRATTGAVTLSAGNNLLIAPAAVIAATGGVVIHEHTAGAASGTSAKVVPLLRNPDNWADVNGDGRVTSLDAFTLIAALRNANRLAWPRTVANAAATTVVYLDTDGDGRLTALDVFRVIAVLRGSVVPVLGASAPPRSGETGEGEAGGAARGTPIWPSDPPSARVPAIVARPTRQVIVAPLVVERGAGTMSSDQPGAPQRVPETATGQDRYLAFVDGIFATIGELHLGSIELNRVR